MKFNDFGAPAKLAGISSYAPGIDKYGNPVVFINMAQDPDPFFLVMVRTDTGEAKQFSSNSHTSNYPYGLCVASNGLVYLGSCCDAKLFEFDPKTEIMREIGHPAESETYIWNLTEGTDKKIYGCTYGNCHMVRYDPASDKMEDLGRMDPSEEYLRWACASDDGYIYAAIGTVRQGITAYEIATGKVSQLIPEDQRKEGTPQIFTGENGEIYSIYNINNAPAYFRLKNGTASPILKDEAVPKIIKLANGEVLEKCISHKLFIKDTKTGESRVVEYDYHPEGIRIFVLGVGPDKKVYGSSILPEYLCSVDPVTREAKLLGIPSPTGGEAYSFLNMHNRLWIASYPGGQMSVYDPSKAWNNGSEEDCNPRYLTPMSNNVHRPYIMCAAPDGENILVGGVPDYGMVGGSLIIYNPKQQKVEEEFKNIVQDQSIFGLCITKSGLVCAGSSIEGGGGANITETEAKLILWDYEKREKILEIIPVPGAEAITDLTLASDNNIYGFADDTLIVFNPESRKLIHTEQMPYGKPAFRAMTQGPNNELIALLGSDIVKITPETYTHKNIAKYENGITGGIAVIDNEVFFISDSHIISLVLSI